MLPLKTETLDKPPCGQVFTEINPGDLPTLDDYEVRAIGYNTDSKTALSGFIVEQYREAGFEIREELANPQVKGRENKRLTLVILPQPNELVEHELTTAFPPIKLLPYNVIPNDVYLGSYADGYHPVGVGNILQADDPEQLGSSFNMYSHDLADSHVGSFLAYDGLFDFVSAVSLSTLEDGPVSFAALEFGDLRFEAGEFDGEEKIKRMTTMIDFLTGTLGGARLENDLATELSYMGRSVKILDHMVDILRDKGRLTDLPLVQKAIQQYGIEPDGLTGQLLAQTLLSAAREKCGIPESQPNRSVGLFRKVGQLVARL